MYSAFDGAACSWPAQSNWLGVHRPHAPFGYLHLQVLPSLSNRNARRIPLYPHGAWLAAQTTCRGRKACRGNQPIAHWGLCAHVAQRFRQSLERGEFDSLRGHSPNVSCCRQGLPLIDCSYGPITTSERFIIHVGWATILYIACMPVMSNQ